MEQADKISGLAPDEQEIRWKVANSLSIKVQALPYMIGFSWQYVIVDNEVRFKLVPDANGLGTKNNPIIFVQYVQLIPNAHYLHDKKVYKYTGEKTSVISWDYCDELMVPVD